MGKSKVWKRYKNVTGENFESFWEDLDDSAREEWHNEYERRKASYRSKRTSDEKEKNEVSSSKDK